MIRGATSLIFRPSRVPIEFRKKKIGRVEFRVESEFYSTRPNSSSEPSLNSTRPKLVKFEPSLTKSGRNLSENWVKNGQKAAAGITRSPEFLNFNNFYLKL